LLVNEIMESLKKYLQNFPHYHPSVFEDVKPYIKTIEFTAGDYFLREGSVCKHIGFIEKGLFRLYYLNDGKEVTNCFCKENTITCSYRSLITQQPSDVAIQAIEDATLLTFSYDSLQQLYEKNLFWQQMGRLAGEAEYINMDCHNRFLTDLSATERYKQVLENEEDLLQRVPLKYLASYLQIAPETLSRIRKKIART